jgi:hypothetical protein
MSALVGILMPVSISLFVPICLLAFSSPSLCTPRFISIMTTLIW